MKRFTADEALDAQSPTEAIPALAPSTHRLQLDFVYEELPEHLARLRGVAAEERGHIADPFSQSALEVSDIQARDPAEPLELRYLGLERGLPSFLGTQAALDLVRRERAIRQGVD